MKSYQRTFRNFAAAAALLITARASAISVSTGDLILGFRASGGVGQGVNLEVNLGPASGFYAPGSPAFAVTGLSAADLSFTYGADWATRTDLSWGIVGTTGSSSVGIAPARTIWASAAELTPGTPSDPWTRSSTAGLQNASNAIATMYNGAAGALGAGAATPNSATASYIDSTLPGSWTVQDDLVDGTSFRRFNPTVTGSMDFPATPALYDAVNGYAVLDLWEIRPGTSGDPGTLVGAFGLAPNGNLVFSVNPGVFAAVPEPSVTGACFAAAMMLLGSRRRGEKAA